MTDEEYLAYYDQLVKEQEAEWERQAVHGTPSNA